MRKSSYDSLNITVSSLKNKLRDHKAALEKADINDQDSLQKAVDEYDDVNYLCYYRLGKHNFKILYHLLIRIPLISILSRQISTQIFYRWNIHK